MSAGQREPRIVIVGAGIGGIAAAIELRRHGFGDITILERAPGLGGTWLHNDYPGAACDVPSHLYSFSYAQRRDWSRLCSPQREILTYLRGVAAAQGVDGLIVADTEVSACDFDEGTCRWTVTTTGGSAYDADAIVLATGQLHRPAYPRIEGAETFAGRSFHSAAWDHGHDLSGLRVAVIGSGASAVQLVPEIAGRAARVTVFQRSANWFLPRRNRPYPAIVRAVVRRVPGVQALRRRFVFNYTEGLTALIRHPRGVGLLGRMRSGAFMRRQLPDRDLRRRAWPDYAFGCKRVLFSSHYLPTLARPDVELVTDPIVRITPTGVRTADETTYELDCIVFATGFRTTDFMFPMEVTGTGGRRLRDAWSGGAHAHLGMTVPGFPSMFVLYGPNTNTSGGSIIVYLEAQAAYIRQALEHQRATGAGALDVRADVEAAGDRALQARFRGTAWTRCDSWYRDAGGRIVTNWPGYMREYVAATRELDRSHYVLLTPNVDTLTDPPGAAAQPAAGAG